MEGPLARPQGRHCVLVKALLRWIRPRVAYRLWQGLIARRVQHFSRFADRSGLARAGLAWPKCCVFTRASAQAGQADGHQCDFEMLGQTANHSAASQHESTPNRVAGGPRVDATFSTARFLQAR